MFSQQYSRGAAATPAATLPDASARSAPRSLLRGGLRAVADGAQPSLGLLELADPALRRLAERDGRGEFGLCRRKFLRRPGTVRIEILPAIEPGLDKVAFQAILQERIETASDRLLAQGRAELAARGMDPLANS